MVLFPDLSYFYLLYSVFFVGQKQFLKDNIFSQT